MRFAGSLDTNVVLRVLLNDIPDQCKVAQAIIEGSDTPFMVSDTAIIETNFALTKHYKFTRQQSSTLITAFLQTDYIVANFDVFKAVYESYIQHPSLSFEDCYLAVKASSDEASPLLTFDKELAKKLVGTKLLD